MFGEKKDLSAQGLKMEFIKSIHSWLVDTLEKRGNGEYKDNFVVEGSSIMCHIPENFFANFNVPEGTVIEMKFVAKKSSST